MQVKKINHYRAGFKDFLQSPQADANLYIWESQRKWQENWDPECLDMAAMLDRCLQNSTTRRLWNREAYAPKEMLLIFARRDPHLIREIFRELFNEERGLEGRMSRFVFFFDQLLDAYREEHPGKKINSHYHDDGYEIISVYLSFQYPESYIPYSLELFQDIMHKIGATNPPMTHDTERYFKVARTLEVLIKKDEELLARHEQRLDPQRHYLGESRLLVYDFLRYIAAT